MKFFETNTFYQSNIFKIYSAHKYQRFEILTEKKVLIYKICLFGKKLSESFKVPWNRHFTSPR